MHSAIYVGQVRHRRMQPVGHEFRYRLFMMMLDLDELDQVFAGRWFWSTRRRALARLLQRFRFEVCAGARIDRRLAVTMAPGGGLPVRLLSKDAAWRRTDAVTAKAATPRTRSTCRSHIALTWSGRRSA